MPARAQPLRRISSCGCCGIAVVTSLSLCRFVVFGIPTLLGGWYTSNKQWLGTLLLGALIWGAFYLMKG